MHKAEVCLCAVTTLPDNGIADTYMDKYFKGLVLPYSYTKNYTEVVFLQ